MSSRKARPLLLQHLRHRHEIAEHVQRIGVGGTLPPMSGWSVVACSRSADAGDQRVVPFLAPHHRRAAGVELDGRIGREHGLDELAVPVHVAFGGRPVVLPAGPKARCRSPSASRCRACGWPLAARSLPIGGLARAVAVLDPLGRLLGRAVAGVHADHRLAADRPAEGDELVGAEEVVLLLSPGVVGQGRPLLDGADAVPPVIAC